MRKKRFKKKLLAVFLTAAVAVTMIPAGLAVCTDESLAAVTYAYTINRSTVTVNGEKATLSVFSISSLGIRGACCSAGNTARKGKATVTRLSNTELRVRLMYYYGYQKGYLGKTNMNGLLLGRALSWASGNKTTWPFTAAQVTNYITAMPSSVTVPNRFECYFCNPTNGSQNFMAFKMNPPGYVTLKKASSDARSMAAGSGYSFEGIEYTVYDSKGAAAGVLRCKANGTANTLTLDTGTYTVKETKTNQWYRMNDQTYTRNLTAGQTWTIPAADAPETGTVRIRKRVVGSYEGDLAFDFKLTNTANSAIVYTVRTDAETGEAEARVVQGTYRCEEILSEDSDLMDMTGTQTAEVSIGETCTFERENSAPHAGVLQVRKTTTDGGPAEGFRFKVTGELYNQGQLTEDELLQAAEPSVSGYDEEVFAPDDWAVSEKDLDALNKAAADRETGKKTVHLTGALKYKGENGSDVAEIVEGLSGEETKVTIARDTCISDESKTYRAKEEAAFAVAYTERETPEIDKEKTADNIRTLLEGEAFEEADTSDIELSAEVTVNVKPVEYVRNSEEPEKSAYEADPEKQIKDKKLKTEEQGGYEVTCANFDWCGAATLYQEIENGELTGNAETVLETEAGGSTPALEEGITYGSFTVEEVMTDSQKKRYRQPKTQTKKVTQKDGTAAFVFSFENEAKWTGTELVKTSPDGNISGITFRLEGKDSRGENVVLEAVTDTEGKIDFGNLYAGEYVVSEKDFDPDKYENNDRLEGYDVPAKRLKITGDEEEKVTVQFDNVPLKTLYLTKVDQESQIFLENAVFSLLEGEKQLALFRIVLDDNGSAGIDMISCDENSGIRVGEPQLVGDYNFATLRGLREGKSYTLKEVTAPTGYAASVNKTFTFEDGQEMVLENAAPRIGTLAVDQATKMHLSDAAGTVTIVDTVSYTNLAPGHKYLMSGLLAFRPVGERTEEEQVLDAESIDIVKDARGKEVTAKKEFVPESEDGTMKMEFTFDASLLDGRQIVAMEQLTDPKLNGVNGDITVLASHEDIEDEAQSIYFPALKTTASSEDTGKHITAADGEVTIIDTIAYSNVIAGKVYVLTGRLMDKETGKPLLSGGAEITSSVTFRAEKDGPVLAAEGEELTETAGDAVELVSGTVEMKFTFNGSDLAGKTAVAFEKLTAGGSLVGEHSDISDEAQTVYLPVIETTASTNGTDMISDKVVYRNLLAGETYVMEGVLMDKATGEELVMNDAPVTARMEFVPEKKDGSIIMEFPVDVRQLEGKTLVAFEACSIRLASEDETEDAVKIEIVSHRDINNEAQTVYFDTPQTGQEAPWRILFPAGLFTAAAILLLFRRLRGI